MLHHGLAGTEGPGDCGGTALGDGKHGIDNTLAGVHGPAGDVLLLIGSCDTDGPTLDHGELMLHALGILHHGHHVFHNVLAALHADDLAGDAVGDHDLMQDGAGLLDGAQHIAGIDLVAGLCHGDEVPLLLPVQGRNIDASGDAVAGLGTHLGQGALDAVIDVIQHAGAKLHGHGHAGGDDLSAGAKAGGLFVDLDGSLVAGHIKDLADQPLRANTHNVGYVGVCQALGHDKRS